MEEQLFNEFVDVFYRRNRLLVYSEHSKAAFHRCFKYHRFWEEFSHLSIEQRSFDEFLDLYDRLYRLSLFSKFIAVFNRCVDISVYLRNICWSAIRRCTLRKRTFILAEGRGRHSGLLVEDMLVNQRKKLQSTRERQSTLPEEDIPVHKGKTFRSAKVMHSSQ